MARAAVVYSVRQNLRLRASAVVDDDYDLEPDAMEIEGLEHMARHRDLDLATNGMEVTVADWSEHSNDISAVSLESKPVSDSSTQNHHNCHNNCQADTT